MQQPTLRAKGGLAVTGGRPAAQQTGYIARMPHGFSRHTGTSSVNHVARIAHTYEPSGLRPKNNKTTRRYCRDDHHEHPSASVVTAGGGNGKYLGGSNRDLMEVIS